MMDCKKALLESDGDMDAATEFLRAKGLAKADKKATRVAAEGRIAVATDAGKAVLVEVNCETDFVAKDGSFLDFTAAPPTPRWGPRKEPSKAYWLPTSEVRPWRTLVRLSFPRLVRISKSDALLGGVEREPPLVRTFT
jgi:hypothetical protein